MQPGLQQVTQACRSHLLFCMHTDCRQDIAMDTTNLPFLPPQHSVRMQCLQCREVQTAHKHNAPETSSACATRFKGVLESTRASYSLSCKTCWARGVRVYQGETAFTLIPSGPHSQHKFFVSWFMAAADTGLICKAETRTTWHCRKFGGALH